MVHVDLLESALKIGPSGRNFQAHGLTNCKYAASKSGFVDRNLYCQWFKKNLLRYAPAERPLLLLQDGASAHLGPELIEAVKANDVILMCFPPKLTHILQPLDVAVYRSLKANIDSTMKGLTVLRGDMWINKSAVPRVFKEAYEQTFTMPTITNAFRKCGIYPFDRNAIPDELLSTSNIKQITCSSDQEDPQSDAEETPSLCITTATVAAQDTTIRDVLSPQCATTIPSITTLPITPQERTPKE